MPSLIHSFMQCHSGWYWSSGSSTHVGWNSKPIVKVKNGWAAKAEVRSMLYPRKISSFFLADSCDQQNENLGTDVVGAVQDRIDHICSASATPENLPGHDVGVGMAAAISIMSRCSLPLLCASADKFQP